MIKSRRITLTIEFYLRQESYHFGWSIGRCTYMDTTPNWKFKRGHPNSNVKIENKFQQATCFGPPSSAKYVEGPENRVNNKGDTRPVRTLVGSSLSIWYSESDLGYGTNFPI